MAGKDELVSVTQKILEADLTLYRDVIQWGAVVLSGVAAPTLPESVLIKTYFEWLGKIPINKETRAVAQFFLGFSKDLPKQVTLFDSPVLLQRQDDVTLNIEETAPFLSEAVGLLDSDLTRISNLNLEGFNLVTFSLPWFEEKKTLEQICVLSFLTGYHLYTTKIGVVH